MGDPTRTFDTGRAALAVKAGEFRPEHYMAPIECWDVWQWWALGPCVSSALKYIARAGKKPGTRRDHDLRKASTFLARACYIREPTGLVQPYDIDRSPHAVSDAWGLDADLRAAVDHIHRYASQRDLTSLRMALTSVRRAEAGGPT